MDPAQSTTADDKHAAKHRGRLRPPVMEAFATAWRARLGGGGCSPRPVSSACSRSHELYIVARSSGATECDSAWSRGALPSPQPRPWTYAPGLLAELVDDGEAPVLAEGARRDLDADGPLPPLVLVAIDHGDHPPHRRRLEAARHDVRHTLVALHVALEDRVQILIGRQRVLVLLARAQFGRGRPGEDRPRDDLPPRPRIGLLGELVHEGLRAVLDAGEAARHVAVERGVAYCDLALVPRVEDEPAELIGQRHQVVAADAGLEVLLRHVFLQTLEGG